jgi:DNA-binding NarL/FixJ family response regulator
MSSKIKILIVDDHEIFRRGLRDSLEEFPEFLLVGEASNGPEAVEMCQQLNPDVVLMDIHMPGGDGIHAVREIKKLSDTHVLMLTVSENDQDLLTAIEAGADGYLLKNAKPDQLFSAIRSVVAGMGALSPEVTGKVLKAVNRARAQPATIHLSDRESQVLALLARGSTTLQIAVALSLSENTVKTFVQRVLKKLGASNRAEAVARASALGLLSYG